MLTDHPAFEEPEARPVEELVLALTAPRIEARDGKRRATATAMLVYEPAHPGAHRIESRPFNFTAPLGPIERDDLRWYLESYHLWPVGVFKDRADGTERKLPDWGRDLFQAAFGDAEARETLSAWQNAQAAERRFSVAVNGDLPEGSTEEARAEAREAATELLSLPWELLHDGRLWLFQGEKPVRVRRRLPHRQPLPARPTTLPIRILLVSPRPEKDGEGNPIGYIDHRISARPLTDAVESLGGLARLTVLQPPTFAALKEALQAGDEGEPFDVLHFDGHGAYDPWSDMGGLCFEEAADVDRLEDRAMEFVYAGWLGRLVRQHRIPLVFLEACQSAVAKEDPTASVAARLLAEGVASVVAMSHSVLVETSRLFVTAFYGELAGGARVGQAMLASQQALFEDPRRGKILGAGELRLQDWFVPVLYQEAQDPQLITRIPPQQVRQLEENKRRLRLGNLPEPPPHFFQGRSRDLLALERLLHRERWAVVRGIGGQGKTTLATELARWLVRTERFARAAFVSLEHHRYAEAVLDTLGHQLLPDGDKYSVAQYPDLDEAIQLVEHALADQPTIVVLDNCESILPERTEPAAAPPSEEDEDASTAIFALCQRLLEADPRTRLVFTTRESLPAPFDHGRNERELRALGQKDAIGLVSEVMKQNGWKPPDDNAGSTPEEIIELVEAVNRHARALVLLAREVAQRGVKTTTENLHGLMADLERKHPGDRENSLYASVELSLRRLSAEAQKQVRALAVCHGGVQLNVLATVSGLGIEAASQLAIELIEVGLGQDMGYGHLRLDPGLQFYLLETVPAHEMASFRSLWVDGMKKLTGYLYETWFENAPLAVHLVLLELPNIVVLLKFTQDYERPELVVELAAEAERLVAELGRPQALALVTRVRDQAAKKLGDWSHASHLAESTTIERLMQVGDLSSAYTAAQRLLEKSLAASESAYPGAAFDIAKAHAMLGHMLKERGAAEAALAVLMEAKRRFQELADENDTEAERMVSVTITETGDCLKELGRLEKAAEAYEIAIGIDRRKNRIRDIAAGKGQLGGVRLMQKRFQEALTLQTEALDTFTTLGEPRMVATAWYQVGRVYQEAGQPEAAENAYRKALEISVRDNIPAQQDSALNALGLLCASMNKLEEAVAFYRQAVEICMRFKDFANEGRVRGNLATILIELGRHAEARQELRRTIECFELFGHALEPWKAWSILEDLERATGHNEAAKVARRQSIETYLAYRRSGGTSQSNRYNLFVLVAQAGQKQSQGEARHFLGQLSAHPNAPPFFKALALRLQSILDGERSPSLVEDPELEFWDSAELQLLLESLSPEQPEGMPA